MSIALYCGLETLRHAMENTYNPSGCNIEYFTNSMTFKFTNFLFYSITTAITICAILVAINCNPGNKLIYGILAFFFSEIYLIQFVIRKYLFKERGYCSAF